MRAQILIDVRQNRFYIGIQDLSLKIPQLPSAEALSRALEKAQVPVDIYAVHGMLNGMYCAGLALNSPQWLSIMWNFMAANADSDPLSSMGEDGVKSLEQMQAQVTSVYDNRLAVPILLPPFSQDLAAKAAALGAWCDGWLSGFGGVFEGDNDFPAELEDTVRELTEISHLDSEIDSKDEEAEQFLQDLIDHVSQAVEYVYDSLNGGTKDQSFN